MSLHLLSIPSFNSAELFHCKWMDVSTLRGDFVYSLHAEKVHISTVQADTTTNIPYSFTCAKCQVHFPATSLEHNLPAEREYLCNRSQQQALHVPNHGDKTQEGRRQTSMTWLIKSDKLNIKAETNCQNIRCSETQHVRLLVYSSRNPHEEQTLCLSWESV